MRTHSTLAALLLATSGLVFSGCADSTPPGSADLTGEWTGGIKSGTDWTDVLVRITPDGMAVVSTELAGAAEQEGAANHDGTGAGQGVDATWQYEWTLSGDAAHPVVTFRDVATGERRRGALRAEEKLVLEGDSLNLVRE